MDEMSAPARTRRPAHRPAVSRAAAERLILLLVVGTSLAAIWWSVNRYQALQRQTAALQKRLSHLQADLDLMQSRWPDARRADVDRRFAEVPEHLFQGEQSFATWMDQIRRGAPPLALAAQVSVLSTRTETNGPTPLTIIQAQVDFPAAADIDANRPLYQRLIQFSQQLTSSPERVDLLEANLAGSDSALNLATALVEVWTSVPQPPTP
jgi:hypothetical protein